MQYFKFVPAKAANSWSVFSKSHAIAEVALTHNNGMTVSTKRALSTAEWSAITVFVESRADEDPHYESEFMQRYADESLC